MKQSDDQLLARYAPIVYLNPDETTLPSSIEWMLQRTRLVNSAGQTVLSPVGSSDALVAAGAAADWSLELLSDDDRRGQGTDAPVYGTVRPVTQGGTVVAYDCSYWYFYPFNGNIFDFFRARAILGAVVAAGTIGAFLFPPFAYLVVAAAAAALAYLDSVEGIQMHESDWEENVVRVDLDGNILGVFYSAHGAEVGWLHQLLPEGSDSRDGYTLRGTRPVVYSAVQSHATYPYAGVTQRLGGFADDQTDAGQLWDPLASVTSDNPMGRLINMGHDIDNPPEGQNWIQYPGLWGRKGGGGGVFVEWFGAELQEYADGKPGPAQRGSWTNGEPNAPTDWPTGATLLTDLEPAGAAFTIAEYKGFLCAAYTQPNDIGLVSCAIYNGTRWLQPDVPGLTALGNSASIAMQACQGVLHCFYRVATDLEWAQLIIDDDGHTTGWAFTPFPPPIAIPNATGDLSATQLSGVLYLLFENEGALHLLSYDGQNWTDLTSRFPLPNNQEIDGPVALAAYAGFLFAAFGSGGALREAQFTPGQGWQDITPPSPVRNAGPNGVAMEVFGGYLYLAYATRGGLLYWTRRTASGDWLANEGGGDFPVGSEISTGRFGLAVSPNPSFLALVFPGQSGSLYLTDMLATQAGHGEVNHSDRSCPNHKERERRTIAISFQAKISISAASGVERVSAEWRHGFEEDRRSV